MTDGESNPSALVGDIEMHAMFSRNNYESLTETIETATSNGLTVVLYVFREEDMYPKLRWNERVTVAEVSPGEVRLP